MENMKRIPENIKIYLQEIAEKMSQGRAVVMIGSGFSKNAQKCRSTDKKFLDWNQLGDIFYKKLYGIYPSEENMPNYYLDVLKLASKVQYCFGRTTLDRLLIDNLPDEEYEPSELHELLLKLNWTDIFTTNYDTLLERTRIRVFDRRYQVVLNKFDLVYSRCPRIIKLHGSFPSTRPFILTEEDYRTYPKEFAVFVNTVRQSLIENVMCMIGFSGDDPNFLNWIGWIKDNMGNDSASKIYLVGIFDMRETELKLYESHNIVFINLRDCDGIGANQYKEGLKLFFEALNELQELSNTKEKPLDKENNICALIDFLNIHDDRNREREIYIREELNRIIDFWKDERECYPGWIIMPYNMREKIEKTLKTENDLLILLDKQIEFSEYWGEILYEYDWRRKSCLLSLDEETAKLYENYLSAIADRWTSYNIELGFSLMCHFRENGDFDNWEKMYEYIISQDLDEDQKMYLYFEQACKLFYNFEYYLLSKKLLEWPKVIRNGKTILIHATLLCEMGYYEKAIWLLKSNLNCIREQTSGAMDYLNDSKEAYIIIFLDYMERYYRFISKHDSKNSDRENNIYLRALWSRGCNPEYERDYLIRKTVSVHLSNHSDAEYELCNGSDPSQVINFMEEAGSIFRNSYYFQHTEEYIVSVSELAKKNPYKALIFTIRFDDVSACRQIWNKKILIYLTCENVDQIIETCICACEKNKITFLEMAESDMSGIKVNPKNIITVLPKLIPTIIAGIVSKASTRVKGCIIQFIRFVLDHSEYGFVGINLMTKALIASLTQDELSLYMAELTNIPPRMESDNNAASVYWDVIEYLDYRKILKQNYKVSKSFFDTEEPYCNIRKLVYSILTGDPSYGKAVIQSVEKMIEETHTSPFVKVYYFYQILYGKEEYIAQAKLHWMRQLEQQVEQFKEEGFNYCLDFRNETESLLLQLKFYHHNTKEKKFIWDACEIRKVLCILCQWTDVVADFYKHKCTNYTEYFDGWCLLEEIFLEILFHGVEFTNNTLNVEMKKLKTNLNQIGIPFVVNYIFTNGIPDFTREISHKLTPKLFDNGRTFIEIGKITGMYLIHNTQDNIDLKEFWNLILYIGEYHKTEMTYLQSLISDISNVSYLNS